MARTLDPNHAKIVAGLSPAHRVLLRIREEMLARHIVQRDLAKSMGVSQGKIAKLMVGGINLTVNDLAKLAEAVGLPLVECVRERGREFVADCTPSEVALLERLRRRPAMMQAVLQLLDVSEGRTTAVPVLGTRKKAGGKPRGRADDLMRA